MSTIIPFEAAHRQASAVTPSIPESPTLLEIGEAVHEVATDCGDWRGNTADQVRRKLIQAANMLARTARSAAAEDNPERLAQVAAGTAYAAMNILEVATHFGIDLEKKIVALHRHRQLRKRPAPSLQDLTPVVRMTL